MNVTYLTITITEKETRKSKTLRVKTLPQYIIEQFDLPEYESVDDLLDKVRWDIMGDVMESGLYLA